MPKYPDSRSRRAGVLAALAVVTLCAVVARPSGAALFGVADPEAETLVRDLGEHFHVLVLSGGYAVTPKNTDARFAVIEVQQSQVLVDGEARSAEALAALLGDDADRLLALSGDPAAAGRLAAGRPAVEAEKSRRPRVRTDTRVRFGQHLTVEADERTRDVVVIAGTLEVRGEVRGDAVVVGGSAEIDGEVGGEVTVVGGSVTLGPRALVRGGLTAVGGSIHRAPGARIDGEVTEVSLLPLEDLDLGSWFDSRDWPGRGWHRPRLHFEGFDLAELLTSSMALAVLILLIVLVARRPVAGVARRARLEPWRAGLVGFIIEVLIAPILVVISLVLLVSLIGIPLLVVFLPVALIGLAVLFFVGYAGVAQALGESFASHRSQIDPYLAVLIGLVLIQLWQLFGAALSLIPGPIRVAAVLMMLLGFFVKYVAWTVGLGAVVLQRFSPAVATPVAPSAAALPPLPDLDDTDVSGEP